MPRALRIQYPSAVYHVMNRGDRREPIFRDDLDHKRFLAALAEVCTKMDWQVRAYCLIARRLRGETAGTLKWIAAELHMGKWTHVSNLLTQAQQPKPNHQTELNLCQ